MNAHKEKKGGEIVLAQKAAERHKLFRYLLLFLAVLQVVKFFFNYVNELDAIMYYQLFFGLFFLLFYALDHVVPPTNEMVHFFIGLLFVLLTFAVMHEKNLGLTSYYLLIVALFAYVLLDIQVARFYGVAVLVTKTIILIFFSSHSDFYLSMQMFFFSVMFLGTFDLLAMSRNHAQKELSVHLEDLHARTQEALDDAKTHKQMLIQASKMASLGELLSAISHQWKQPLSNLAAIEVSMRVNLELSGKSDPQQSQFLNMLEEQIAFMNQTMDDFRTYFHAKATLSAFNVEEAIHHTVRLLSSSFKEQGIFVDISIPDNLLPAYGNAPMFKQALLNVLANSKDAIIEKKPADHIITIEVGYREHFITITISDQAGGVTPEVMQQLFTKYYTTKGAKGTGLGLAMTKEIIENFCNGKIAVENIPNGLKTTLCIPLEMA